MKAATLGELEKQIMDILWEAKHPLSVAEVVKVISGKRKIAYTTVMTIMGRLVEKGLLKRNESGKAYIYQPTYSKEKFLSRVSRQIIKNFIANFGEAAVAHFAQEVNKLAPEKRKQLSRLLKEVKE